MADVQVIARKIGNFSAAKNTTADQVAFSTIIKGGTLNVKNKLRLTMFWKGGGMARRVCPADSPPPAGSIGAELAIPAVDYSLIGSGAFNLFGSWGFIDSNEKVYMLTWDTSAPPAPGDGAGGGFAGYPDSAFVLHRMIGDQGPSKITLDCEPQNVASSNSNTILTKIPSAYWGPGTGFGGGPHPSLGTSDEPSYLIVGNQDFSYFSVQGNSEVFYHHTGSYQHFVALSGWAKRGNVLYLPLNSGFYFGPDNHFIASHNATTGAEITHTNALQSSGLDFQGSFKTTANYLYVLQANQAGAGNPSQQNKIRRMDLTTLALVDTIDLGDSIEARAMEVVTDNFIYLLCKAFPHSQLYYWDGSLHLVGDIIPDGVVTITPFHDMVLWFKPETGFLYVGDGGFNDSINIVRLGPLEC